MFAQPISEVDISRLKSIYGATKSIPFDAMKVKLEIKKKVDTATTPKLLTNIFNKLNQHLRRLEGDSTNWLLPSRFQPQNKLESVLASDGNVRLYHGFKGYKLSEGQTSNQAWREKMDIGTQCFKPKMQKIGLQKLNLVKP